MCSACFPRSNPPAGTPLSSTGSSGASSPASSVLPERYDFLPPIPLRFVTFAWRYLSLHSLSSLLGGECPAKAWSWLARCLQPGISLRRRQDLASSWGISIVHSHMFSRRRQDGRTRPVQCSRMAPGMRKAKAPTKELSTLNSMAFGLAVYASQCGLPTPHARLASGRWSGATGRAFHPQDSAERFPSCFLTSHPPFPSFLSQSHPSKQDVHWRNRGRATRPRTVVQPCQ
jgi:hypothetical protein